MNRMNRITGNIHTNIIVAISNVESPGHNEAPPVTFITALGFGFTIMYICAV